MYIKIYLLHEELTNCGGIYILLNIFYISSQQQFHHHHTRHLNEAISNLVAESIFLEKLTWGWVVLRCVWGGWRCQAWVRDISQSGNEFMCFPGSVCVIGIRIATNEKHCIWGMPRRNIFLADVIKSFKSPKVFQKAQLKAYSYR